MTAAREFSAVATRPVLVVPTEVYRCPRPGAPPRHVLVRKVDPLDMPPVAVVVEVTRTLKLKEPGKGPDAEKRRRFQVGLRLIDGRWQMPPPYERVREASQRARTKAAKRRKTTRRT